MDELDKLIVNENETANISLLASLIEGKIKFAKEDGEIIFEKGFYDLKDWQKILIYLLGRKVILIKKLKKEFDEKISPKDISDNLGMPSKSISKYAARDLRGLIKSDKGKYFIPNYNLYKCKEVLKIK